MKFLMTSLFATLLCSSLARAQETRPLSAVSISEVRFESASVTFDKQKESFSMALLFKNTSGKAINMIAFELAVPDDENRDSQSPAFKWKLHWTAPLPANKKAGDIMTERFMVPEQKRTLINLFENPTARIAIVKIVFSDGTTWVRPN